jgi:hypothetical protein
MPKANLRVRWTTGDTSAGNSWHTHLFVLSVASQADEQKEKKAESRAS